MIVPTKDVHTFCLRSPHRSYISKKLSSKATGNALLCGNITISLPITFEMSLSIVGIVADLAFDLFNSMSSAPSLKESS